MTLARSALVSLCTLLVFIAACSGPPCFCRLRTTAVTAPDAATAQLTIISPRSTQAVYVLDADAGTLLATTYVRTRMTFSLPPGPRRLLVVTRRTTDMLEVNLAPGRQYYALIRFLAVPFGPDMAVRALTPHSEDWSQLPQYLGDTTEYELDPDLLDERQIDRAVRHVERRQREGVETWASADDSHRAERTIGPGDFAPM